MGDLATSAAEREAAFFASGSHSRIGGVASVIADRTGRVDVYVMLGPVLLQVVLHDGLTSGRPTDVAQTDEENRLSLHRANQSLVIERRINRYRVSAPQSCSAFTKKRNAADTNTDDQSHHNGVFNRCWS